MPLTLYSEPKKLNALFRPIVYEFEFQKSYPNDLASFLEVTPRLAVDAYSGKLGLDVTAVVVAQGLPLYGISVGAYYYLVSKPSDTLLYPEAVTLIDVVQQDLPTLGLRWLMVFDVDYYATGAEDLTSETVSVFSLAAWAQLEPQYKLFVSDQEVSAPFDVTDLETGRRIVQINSDLFSQFSPVQPPISGNNPEYYRKFRLDYGTLGTFTAGKEYHVLNASVDLDNPSCANADPIWKWDESTIRCKYNSPRSSSQREAKYIDDNPDSATYGEYRDSGAYFDYDSDSTACPITFYNKKVQQAFTKNNCPSNQQGTQVTFVINAGVYSSDISQADADNKATTALAAGGQAYANANGSCQLLVASIRLANVSTDYPDANGGIYQTADVYLDIRANGQYFTPSALSVNLQESNDFSLGPIYAEVTSVSSKLLQAGYVLEDSSYDSDGNEIYRHVNQIFVRPGTGYTLL